MPEYRNLVEECLGHVAPMVGNREGGMPRRSGYIFISSPASTTPMHFDAEHSFLLQVRGTKHVSVAAFEQQPRRLARELDLYVDGRTCDFPAMQAIAERYTIETGTGVYLPSYIPHWVETEGVRLDLLFDPVLHGVLPPCRRRLPGQQLAAAGALHPRRPGRLPTADVGQVGRVQVIAQGA